MKNGLKPTTGAVWRKPREEGELITLPSGNTARLRPVALDVLITSGELPDFLTPIAAETLWVERNLEANSPEEFKKRGLDKIVPSYLAVANIVVPAALLYPRVVDDPQADDEISLEDIDLVDKMIIFNLAIQPVEVMRKFREEQERNVAAVSNGENNGDAAERVAEDSRSVDGATV